MTETVRYTYLLVLLLLGQVVAAQNLANLPLIIRLRLQKEYSKTNPKRYVEWEVEAGGLVIPGDSVKQHYYQTRLSVINTSQRPVELWLMSCSWYDNFLISNDYAYIDAWGCDKNIATLITIASRDSLVKSLVLCKSIKFDYPCQNCMYGSQAEAPKVGLIVVDDLFKPATSFFDYDKAMRDKSAWKTVWSNPLYLLTPTEAKPEPLRIPVPLVPTEFNVPRHNRH